MKVMPIALRSSLILTSIVGLLFSCKDEGNTSQSPETPQEMYDYALNILKEHQTNAKTDSASALHWIRQAAEAGLIQAQTDLGGLYLEGGKGVELNIEEALRWFQLAADQGSIEAKFFIGYILLDGRGKIQPDAEKALKNLKDAAQGGLGRAQYTLARALMRQTAALEEGLEYLYMAAKQGEVQAACDLGNMYAKGQYVSADMKTAALWYSRAAEGGDARAQLIYALLLLDGEEIPKDEAAGMSWLRMSAGQDHPAAIQMLVRVLRNGADQSEKTQAEAEAWNQRLIKLTATPQ